MSQNNERTTVKAYVETYGCQMNVSDGELMQGILAAEGYELASGPENADVILVNTCAIREHAEQRVLGRVAQLNRLKQQRPELLIGVTGCMAQRMGERLLDRAPYVDLVMGPDAYRGLPAALARLRPDRLPAPTSGESAAAPAGGAAGRAETDVPGAGGDRTHFAPYRGASGATSASEDDRDGRRVELPVLQAPDGAADPRPSRTRQMAVLDFEPHENYEGLEVRRASDVSAWVPIQRGCNYRCTYCIVPYVRGPEKNRAAHDILDEVRGIAADGIAEVTLLGQTVNSYRHGDWDFPRLLRSVARVDGIRRVRFTSPHPNDFTPGLVAAMADEAAVCKHLHLPVQAGHDRTLKRMLRRYTVAEYLEKIEMLREAIPDVGLSTDVIVAFPGETAEEYEATLDLMRTVRFDDAFMYKYSPRDGTPATRLPDEEFIDPDTAQQRLERLIALQRGIQAERNAAEVGRTVEVLVEREAKSEGDMLGRTERNKVVAFPGEIPLVGSFVRVRLTGTTGATFTGERVDAPEAAAQVA